MATDSSVAITAGAGTPIDAVLLTGGDYQQVVQEAAATAVGTRVTYTPSTTATTSWLAADVSRTGILMVNNSSVRVFLRSDTTAPTSTVFDWFLDPGDRWDVPADRRKLAWSIIGAGAGTGNVLASFGTAA